MNMKSKQLRQPVRGQPAGAAYAGLREQSRTFLMPCSACHNTMMFSAPIRIVSEQNQRVCWQAANRRKKQQQNAVAERLAMYPARVWFEAHQSAVKFIVTLARTGKKKLDTDGNVAGFKAVRDSIARFLRLDDGDDRIEWQYAPQVIAKDWQIEVRIEAIAI